MCLSFLEESTIQTTDPIHNFILPVKTKVEISLVDQLAKEIWTEKYKNIITQAQIDYMLEKFQSPQAISTAIETGMLYFLFQDKKSPIGYFAIKIEPNETLFLSKLYLKKESRGTGLGRVGINWIFQFAQKNNLKKVSLTVKKDNSSLIFYEKIGFKIKDSVVTDIGNNFVMDDHIMEYIL